VLQGFGRNDMQGAAQAACAEVAQAAALLESQFGNSRMTGSGSAVFARAGAEAQPVAAMPSELPAGWLGRMCRSLQVHPLAGWAQD
jgi:4-diphosphocytidyl-2-C-methyl-D-erythritol kinase